MCDISFKERVRIFSRDYLKCCIHMMEADNPRLHFTKKFYARLVSTSQVLEDFLDYHGAKNNKHWYLYRELTAAVRHLGITCYAQKHISNRLEFYDLSNKLDFEEQGNETLTFFSQSLKNLMPLIIEEARKLKIRVPKKGFEGTEFPGIATSELIEYDIDDEDKDLQKKNIVKIASDLLRIAASFEPLNFYDPYSIEQIRGLVPARVNEVEIRRYEMLVHNLQSSFDTYVIHGGFLHGNRKLKQLRGLFSVIFHLLQMMGRLLHFYERHLHDAGYKNIYKQVQEQLSELINVEYYLERTINYCLFYVCNFLSNGKQLAREILNEYIERSSIELGIPVKLGFHSRPSLLVAKIVQHYGGEVELCVDKDRFDASSVLDIQWAGGKIQKENISRVVFEGDVRALKDIEILAGVNYGEDSMGKGVPLPSELKYLR
ncbi:MAG: HPr family phosphocarrier protein [Desulfobacterales bacterium]|nr:HPr family phosphocarrier protein [Desulfobacterales bacterium]